jgi:hypothetical protein
LVFAPAFPALLLLQAISAAAVSLGEPSPAHGSTVRPLIRRDQ